MDPAPGANILIRLEVQIPTTLGQVTPIITTTTGNAGVPCASGPAPTPTAKADSAKSSALSGITCPFDTAKVKVAYGATSGVICAGGRATVGYPYGKPNVKVKIYTNLSEGYPVDKPADDAVDLGRTNDWGDWYIDELGSAACGPVGYGVDNRLVVWLEYDGEPRPAIVTTIFKGVCANTTDECHRVSTPNRHAYEAPAQIVPQWHITVSGFSGGKLARLCRKWSLPLNTEPGASYSWISDREGSSRAELFLTRPCHSTWKLVFTCEDCRIEYSLPAGQWCPSGTNIFTTVQTFGLPLDACVPASVVVIPAPEPLPEPLQPTVPPEKARQSRRRSR